MNQKTILKLSILYIIASISFTSCSEMVDFSPYVVDFKGENKNVNQTNKETLLQKQADSIIRIAFTADTHRAFDEFDDFINSVNTINSENPIDFVIHAGDIADFGLPQQYLWGNSFLLKLHSPFFVTLGNHDLVGNGGLAYTEMYGDYNFSFIYGDIKFIFINTNSREYSFNGIVPDIVWLDQELQASDDFTNAVVIFHVPPMDPDFDTNLEEDFRLGIAKYDNVLFTIHGHLHHHKVYTPYEDSTTYVNVYGIENRKFNVIEIKNSNFKVESYEF